MITQNQVKELFSYNPETGIITRKVRTANRNHVGDVVGHAHKSGYLVIVINYKPYYSHRVAFLHYFGFLPKSIDHIDNIKTNNKIKNLRECNQSQNTCNSLLSSKNTSKVKGVSWFKPTKKWMAQLTINGRKTHIGLFKDIADAKIAIEKAREKHHGEFCNHGYLK